ncbi:transposase [Neisseria elongata]|uniref:transposase n=1 Tax=Neisseria elongata TaxID=495 RepID=UPI001F33D894|nr:transposase [Neisseria elongata]
MTQPAEFSDYQLVYLDETGFDRYLFRPYARSLKGQIVKAQTDKWKKIPTRISGVRTSRQPADCSDGLSKYDDRRLFEAWFQQCLLPALTQKSVIILDNARFHRMGVLREIAEKLGHKVLPLAPYSPELNPIEKVWANIKRYLRTVLSDYVRFDDALMSYFDFN